MISCTMNLAGKLLLLAVVFFFFGFGKDGYIKRGNTAGLKFASNMGIGSQGVGANARNVLTKNKKQMA